MGVRMSGLVGVAQGREARQALPGGAVEVSELWLVLQNRWPWVLGSVAAFVILASLFALITPSLYSSAAEILIDVHARQVVARDANPDVVAADGGIVQAESQARVIQSTGVLLRAIGATDLVHDPEFNETSFFRKLLEPLLLRLSSSPRRVSDVEAKTLLALRRVLAVKRADKVLVVEVVVTTKSPEKSALIANAIADAYLADQNEAKAEVLRKASGDLTARLDGQRQRVQDAENAVERYKAQNQIIATSGQLVVEQKLGNANAQLAEAKARTTRLEAKIDQLDRLRRRGGSTDATVEAIQSNVVSSLREQEAILVQQESDLQSQYGPRHPKIAAVESQLDNLRRLITAELGRVEQATRAEYEQAAINQRQIADNVERLKTETLATNEASIRLRELERDLEAARSVYATYLVRAQETHEQANIDTTSARIISRALPAPERSWPLFGLILFGAVCAGLGLGMALAFVTEYLSPTFVHASRTKMRVASTF
jgi:uncharacterized protein involved in exopolysaccharide biosynthesis